MEINRTKVPYSEQDNLIEHFKRVSVEERY
jgi:hypothetical protein